MTNITFIWFLSSDNFYFFNRKSGEIPPYTAKLLDTYLRVVSPVMLRVYGSYYISILQMIFNKILPKLSENVSLFQSVSHKKQLEDFLTTFLESNGERCLAVLNDM